jgi:hypothetical protein
MPIGGPLKHPYSRHFNFYRGTNESNPSQLIFTTRQQVDNKTNKQTTKPHPNKLTKKCPTPNKQSRFQPTNQQRKAL